MSNQQSSAALSFAEWADRMVAAIEQQRWIDLIGHRVEETVLAGLRLSGATGQRVKDFLNGTWFGHPLHPPLTDIPIGAWTVSMIFDVLDTVSAEDAKVYGKAADAAVKIGIAGALAAAATGLADWQNLEPPSRRVGAVHGLLNGAALAAYLVSLRLRKRGSRSMGRFVSTLAYSMTVASSYLGGSLVFRQPIANDRADRSAEPRQHRQGEEARHDPLKQPI